MDVGPLLLVVPFALTKLQPIIFELMLSLFVLLEVERAG